MSVTRPRYPMTWRQEKHARDLAPLLTRLITFLQSARTRRLWPKLPTSHSIEHDSQSQTIFNPLETSFTNPPVFWKVSRCFIKMDDYKKYLAEHILSEDKVVR